ncbi:Mechanosensitive ion channel [Planctomycetes bacterium Poly30]|uniref:Mechanosensitive ion channel n=1 Tax=Saltatorellus ferox TaxID=2528018 RepID=A0A518END9_9BACT|nr:Mechanosensitive ion channel [Planctomycetes bacterium Poly30]
MAILENPLDTGDLPGFGLTLLAFVLVVAVARRLVLNLPERGGYRGQLVLFLVVAAGLLAVLISLPLRDQVRGLVFQFVGLILSAAVALSSTTFLGNLIAGGMLRTISNFNLGDWIRVDDHFGRVTERGLLHTEIQTEDRDLTTIPNLLLATHPVKVVRASGTIISAKVSIGYDVPHVRVEDALLVAANQIGLVDAFVAIADLGDFSIVYRVAGKLEETDRLISRRSKLRRAMLDALHGAEIEIMSPTFMNVLQRSPKEQLIPEEIGSRREADTAPEEVAFDKADLAKGLETKRASIAELEKRIEEVGGRTGGLEGDERSALERELERMKSEAARLKDELGADEETLKGRID